MLKINNLKKNYQDFSLDCSLEIPCGYITGLIGPNGAGKSTTLKLILGLIQPDDGEITIFGKSIQDFNTLDKQEIGVVLSNSGFSEYLTIHDILPILESLYIHFDKKFFMEQIQQFHLPLNKKIKDFSTGMKAKLKILIAISHDAKLLVLDEPTAGLDVIARNELLDLLRNYMEKDEHRSILLSSHISSDLESLCDDFYMMHKGKIILHEDTDILLSDYGILKASNSQFSSIDKNYLLCCHKETFGYKCLTNQRQFYLENYPQIVMEKASIDEIISILGSKEMEGGIL